MDKYNFKPIEHLSHSEAMLVFQKSFEKFLNDTFSSDEIVMAFLFGSIIRGYSSYQRGSGSDLDVFLCLEDNVTNMSSKLQSFHNWYFQIHHYYELNPDHTWPGEVMTRSKLESALYRQPDLQIKLHNNSDLVLDTVSWVPMIHEPSLRKIGKLEDIEKYKQLACFSEIWIRQLIYTLEGLSHQEAFYRLFKLIIPWVQDLMKHLDSIYGLHFSKSKGYSLRYIPQMKELYTSLKDFSEYHPIRTINSSRKLRKYKNMVISDEIDGIFVKHFVKILSNPSSLINIQDPYYRVLLLRLSCDWLNNIFEDLKKNHPKDIASYSFRTMIDWYHLCDECSSIESLE